MIIKPEMVTSICRYEDIETIQELVRKPAAPGHRHVRIHIHIDASPLCQHPRNINTIRLPRDLI